MFKWLARQYAKRIVNINVNIAVASTMAAVAATLIIHLTRYVGITDEDKTLIMVVTYVSDWMVDIVIAVSLHWLANHWPKTWKRSRTLIDKADSVMDAAPPPGLSVVKDAAAGTPLPHFPLPHLPHLPLPHLPGHGKAEKSSPTKPPPPPKKEEVSFVRDATTIQLQRMVLSPVFYGVAAGGQWLALHWGAAREVSVIVPFAVAILATRLCHTLWLIKADPRVLEEWEESRRRRQANNVRAAERLKKVIEDGGEAAGPT